MSRLIRSTWSLEIRMIEVPGTRPWRLNSDGFPILWHPFLAHKWEMIAYGDTTKTLSYFNAIANLERRLPCPHAFPSS